MARVTQAYASAAGVDGFDPVTLVHHLAYTAKCHETKGMAFQKFFEDIMARSEPSFTRIKPYGSLGDKKCDGLLYGDGTAYQVYAPDHLKLADTIEKIDEDLAGAVAEWTELKSWWFVVNAPAGLPAEVVNHLQQQDSAHSHIGVRKMDTDDLWSRARGLKTQQRSEVLGPPLSLASCWPDLLKPDSVLATEAATRRLAILHGVERAIHPYEAVGALGQDAVFGVPLHVGPEPPEHGDWVWEQAAETQLRQYHNRILPAANVTNRFALFSLAPIPLAVHLGALLNNRYDVVPRQYDRDSKTWSWPDETHDTAGDGLELRVTEGDSSSLDAVVVLSISAQVQAADCAAVVAAPAVTVEVRCAEPSVRWLVGPTQVQAVGRLYEDALVKISDLAPSCQRIHLFAAVPTPIAFECGSRYNPRMNGVLHTYQYRHQGTPRYEAALTIEE